MAAARWRPTTAWRRSFAPETLDPDWITSADVLHISGYTLLREPAAEAAIAAAGLARRVTLDLASAHDIERFGRERFTELVRALRPQLVFANQAERAAVPDLEVDWVIKLGADGAIFPEGRFTAESAVVVDATGAGDALAAGYLVGGPHSRWPRRHAASRASAHCPDRRKSLLIARFDRPSNGA